MYLAWGVAPYPANGNGVVLNYPNGTAGYPRLTVVENGTVGAAPQPGDVLSLDNSNPAGHTEIAVSSSVDNEGNGFVKVITENDPPGASGWGRLSVSHWVVSDGTRGDQVIGWLHNPDWTLQQPVVWNITPAGDLNQRQWGPRRAVVIVAGGIAKAEVVGGGGYDASPIVGVLTTSGELEAGDIPPRPRRQLVEADRGRRHLVQPLVGRRAKGHPVLAWVTGAGDVEVSDGGLHNTPLLEARCESSRPRSGLRTERHGDRLPLEGRHVLRPPGAGAAGRPAAGIRSPQE